MGRGGAEVVGPPVSGPLAEALALLEEMHALYSLPEDAERAAAIPVAAAHVAELCETRESHMHQIISELTTRVADARRRASPDGEAAAAHAACVSELEARKQAEAGRFASLSAQAEGLEKEQQALEARRAALQLKRQHLDALVVDDMPRVQNQLSLYAHLTKISWFFEEEDCVAGRVHVDGASDVRAIRYSKTLPAYDLANRLWDDVAVEAP